MKTLLFVVALAACGGKSKPAQREVAERSAAPIATDLVIEMEAEGLLSKEEVRARMAAECGEGKGMITKEGEEHDGKEGVWVIRYRCQ